MEKYQILKDLVGFNTIKDAENEKIINYIENFLVKEGFRTEYKGKYLIMSIGDNPKIGFLGHTDTVEYIDGWNSDPFELTENNGKLYGLGVCDMKGGVAAIMQAISEINFADLKHGMKVHLTYDEEIGFGGIYDIIASKEKFPSIMIFGEPTDNEILSGSKGLLEYELKFNGIKAHSSNPARGKSANMNAVKFLMEMDKFYNEKIKILEEKRFAVPYTTMNVGVINGGSAKNSVAASCTVNVDFRIAFKEHIDIIKTKMDELGKKYDCNVTVIESIGPYIDENELVKEVKIANFITEASLVENTSRIILGPGPVTAHEVNEHITEESYNLLISQYKKMIMQVCK